MAIAAALFQAWLPVPWWLVIPAGAVLAALATCLVLVAEFLLADRRDPQPRGAPATVFCAWRTEVRAHFHAFWVLQPFAADFPEPVPVHEPSRPAVLLVHGFGCNRAIWLPLLRSGQLSGCSLATVDLVPACASIEVQAIRIDQAMRRLIARSGARRVSVVAHSLGGLAVLAYLRRFGDASLEVLIALATPFAGTRAAHLLRCPAVRQMRPADPWRRELIESIGESIRSRMLCVASRNDNVVVPRSSAALPGASVYWIDGVGHLATTCDTRVWQLLRRHIPAPARSGI